MTTETGTFTPTDEDVEWAKKALHDWLERPEGRSSGLRQVLATIGPIIERERRAAKVEALREYADEVERINGNGSGGAAYCARYRADEIERGE